MSEIDTLARIYQRPEAVEAAIADVKRGEDKAEELATAIVVDFGRANPKAVEFKFHVARIAALLRPHLK